MTQTKRYEQDSNSTSRFHLSAHILQRKSLHRSHNARRSSWLTNRERWTNRWTV